ncbi:DHS-like NAD/FAD-binding domain-containing protein, partial [Stereum hirsutum FP-91666 SS1]
IVVLSGAGISCSCGIPDFRSADGLYDLVKQRYPDIFVKGHELFDASVFRDPLLTAAFYTFIAQLKQRIDRSAPSPTHKFLKTLDTKKKLLRSYTQNIDGFEERVGLLGSSSDDARVAYSNGRSNFRGKDVRSILLHGDIHRVRCTLCSTDLPCTLDHIGMFDKGVAPDCVECKARADARVAANKRSIKVGVLRPAIVLYNEPHPLGDEIGAIQAIDIGKKPDLLLIMGTSLKVPGFKKIVKSFADVVHA